LDLDAIGYIWFWRGPAPPKGRAVLPGETLMGTISVMCGSAPKGVAAGGRG
jgi:hypothetical protein